MIGRQDEPGPLFYAFRFGSHVLPREVSLSQGFDAASMGGDRPQGPGAQRDALRPFRQQGAVFEAIAHEECGVQTEAVFSLDPADHDVEFVLTRVGCSFVKFLCCPGAMSPLRTVIAISDRMPEIGREAVRTPIGLARLRPTSRKP